MALFAQIYNGHVEQIILINDEDISDQNGIIQEEAGSALCNQLYQGGDWVLTSSDGSIRYNAARLGDVFDENRNAFITPSPYPSWILNEQTMRYESPTPLPEGASLDLWYWDESELTWKEKYV
jgi:hypothetical protein